MSFITSPTPTIEVVLSRFSGLGHTVKHHHAKNYYSTHDPARQDDRPSLLFGPTQSGGVWFKDMAGISTPAAILAALGLNPETLKPETREFTPRKAGPKRPRLRLDFDHPHATYNYLDSAGHPVYQVRRVNFTRADGQPDKEFRQYQWLDGRWQPGRGETPDLLYRLPEVVKAQRVIGVEGEKAAEALRSVGYLATTHAGGVGAIDKALPAYREWLRGKDFISLPDNDQPGQDMAAKLAAALLPIVASGATVDRALFGGHKADIADVIARLRAELLSNEEIRAEIDRLLAQAQPWQRSTGPKELARLAEREKYLAQAQADKEAKQAQRQARKAEIERRWQAGNCVNFSSIEEIDPDLIDYKRGQFSSAKKWRDYVLAHWPDVDAEEQFRIKAAENHEARPAKCGEYRKMTMPNGQNVTRRWTCGVCEGCLKRAVWTYRRALNEIQGIPSAPAQNLLESLLVDSPPQDDAPRENAPPLPQVKGELSLVTIQGDKERLQLARELRRAGVAYKCFPVLLDNEPHYDFITNDDRGDPLGLAATDHRIKLWVRGAGGKRASGGLLPSLKALQQRYREALPYEVVLPELDDEGQPVDPDIFALELPDIGTTARLPGVTVDFEVHDAETLQAALLEIHQEQWRILGRRGAVNYGVCIHKKFYTRYSTLPAMLAAFNAEQDAIRARRRKKTA
jgi:hypothetical protein